MVTMGDLFDPVLYGLMIEKGYIKERRHPIFPQWVIVNYTDACTWDKVWNEITLQCRGIIYSAPSGEIIARPFSKFFNYGQEGAPLLDLDEKVVIADKLDGSLGILYSQPDLRYAIATRGSFESDQAIWATNFYWDNYDGEWFPNHNWTYLFEIIYPENRIVVNYGDKRALILLGAVETATGRSISVEEGCFLGWPGETAMIFSHGAALSSVLAAEPRPNAEGYVLWSRDRDVRVKVKQEDYMLLHRFMTRTNPKHVWEVMMQGLDPYEYFKEAPDEFQDWLRNIIMDLQKRYNLLSLDAMAEYAVTVSDLPADFTRKDFAMAVKDSTNKALLFRLLDERPIDDIIWKLLKPSGADVHAIREVNPDAD